MTSGYRYSLGSRTTKNRPGCSSRSAVRFPIGLGRAWRRARVHECEKFGSMRDFTARVSDRNFPDFRFANPNDR
jgi:hypothetical protein